MTGLKKHNYFVTGHLSDNDFRGRINMLDGLVALESRDRCEDVVFIFGLIFLETLPQIQCASRCGIRAC